MEHEDTSMKSIAEHINKHVSLPEDQLDIRLIPMAALPEKYAVYYVEKKQSHGNVYYHCVLADGEIYSSAETDGFERLLKKMDYLANRSLTNDQFITLFSMLKGKIRDREIVRKEDLSQGGIMESSKDQASEPILVEKADGVEVVFWTLALRSHALERWSVHVFPDYRVQFKSEIPAAAAP
ncbi:MAG TPA: hypothetical protein VLR94_09995 [Acidobacteriota bacterium]|nr:hypothetical protein [Acidobacteriota bacterium]